MPTTFSPVALRPVLAQAPTPITAVAGLVDGQPTSMIVDDATATFTTRLVEEITTGDHTLAVLEALEALDATSYAEQTPLVFHNSQFKPH